MPREGPYIFVDACAILRVLYLQVMPCTMSCYASQAQPRSVDNSCPIYTGTYMYRRIGNCPCIVKAKVLFNV